MILGDNNSAARLLSRPGEAIYNDAGGLVEANSPFQVAWLPDEKREVFPGPRARARANELHVKRDPDPIVFEGNAPADITKNQKLMSSCSTAPQWPAASDDAAGVAGRAGGDQGADRASHFRRQSGSQRADRRPARRIRAGADASHDHQPRSATCRRQSAKFYIFDGTPADSPLAGTLRRVKRALPHDVQDHRVARRRRGDQRTGRRRCTAGRSPIMAATSAVDIRLHLRAAALPHAAQAGGKLQLRP